MADGHPVLLYGTEHNIYARPYYSIDGTNYYVLDRDIQQLEICTAPFEHEQTMSLMVTQGQRFGGGKTEERVLHSKRYADMSVRVSVGKGLIYLFASFLPVIVYCWHCQYAVFLEKIGTFIHLFIF